MSYRYMLLVEDSPDDVTMTLRALRKGGIVNEVVVTEDGTEALAFLNGTGQYAGRDTSIKPSVIVLDLNMPRLGGLELLKRLREEERTLMLPVVVLTTSGEERHRVESYRLGANSFVQKPTDFDEFTHAIQQVGSYWLGLNEAP